VATGQVLGPAPQYPGHMVRPGTQSESVTVVQDRLKQLGILNTGLPNGVFEGNTQAAIQEFQRQNGIAPNGVVDNATWNALFNW
jgi:peptidoglycan hydrolase-like protein with peptidoglycan-binding domain